MKKILLIFMTFYCFQSTSHAFGLTKYQYDVLGYIGENCSNLGAPYPPACQEGLTCAVEDGPVGVCMEVELKQLGENCSNLNEPPFPPSCQEGLTCAVEDGPVGICVELGDLGQNCSNLDEPPFPPACKRGLFCEAFDGPVGTCQAL